MSVQVKRRRDTAANLASFTGAQAELLVDTTNNRLQVHDGVTPGGWPAAKLSEAVLQSEVGAASGVASLDGSGHVPITQLPAAIAGALSYEGVWNASTNSPTLASGTGTKGYYYKVSVAGTATIDGNSQWNVGDLIAFDGTMWDKIDGDSNEVISVAGQVGVVTATQISAAINTRTAVSDTAYVILTTDRLIAYTALTAARVVSLPAASAYPTGVVLWVVDESGACSATNTITVTRAGSDTVNGAASTLLNTSHAYVALESNGSNAWTIVDAVSASSGGSGGGVTSVGLSLPSIFSISGSPVTSSGSLTASLVNQVANTVFAGPSSGSAAAPTFRALALADLPSGAIISQRTAVSDAAYSVLTTDRLVAYTALTAARAVSLPAASAYPTGVVLWVVDESGACSASKTITINRAGSDTIDGATSFIIDAAYGALALESNGSNAWTILSPTPNVIASLVGVGTAPDPNNPLSVYGASALFNGTNFNVTVNKAAASDTASLIFEDGFSGRAQMGLNGSDNFSFKVSANGSGWTTAIALDAATGAATLANQRTAVSDAAYSALLTDRLIAYTALTTARTVSLPAASAYPPGQALTIADESGECSATLTITINRAGSDAINGATSAVLSSPYAFMALESNGSNAWTIVDQSTLSMGQQAASAVAITGGSIAGVTLAGATLSLARHAVSNAPYSVAAGIATVAYTSITAARTVSLPAANSFNPSQQLLIVDESGSCSTTNTITAARAGSDTINGGTSAIIQGAYGYLNLESNGSNAWTIVGQDLASMIQALATSKPSTAGVPWNDGGGVATT